MHHTARSALCVLWLLLAALASPPARAQQNDTCEVDFPVFNIPWRKACTSAADCPAGTRCEQLRNSQGNPDGGTVCSDFTAEFLDDCDNPDGPRMASPGCRQEAGLVCDVDYDGKNGVLRSAVCRKRVGESCSKNSDCAGVWKKAPDVVCVEGKCQQYGFAELCKQGQKDGDRCPGGQVCTSLDSSLWISGSEPVFGCFNRADRGEKCKGSLNNNFGSNNGYSCKEETETASLGYNLFCDEARSVDNDWVPGVCRSWTYEEGAACGPNILCAQMDCVNGKCKRNEEAPGNECSADSDCRGWNNGVAPDTECKNGRCVALGYVGECFKAGDKCPGGQTCWSVPDDSNPNRNSCINRAAKGEPCKAPRWGPFNAYACKLKSETGYDMRCKFGPDAVAVAGPGPGGAGGGVAGTGLCMEIVKEEGGTCGDEKLQVCDWNADCVDGRCQKRN